MKVIPKILYAITGETRVEIVAWVSSLSSIGSECFSTYHLTNLRRLYTKVLSLLEFCSGKRKSNKLINFVESHVYSISDWDNKFSHKQWNMRVVVVPMLEKIRSVSKNLLKFVNVAKYQKKIWVSLLRICLSIAILLTLFIVRSWCLFYIWISVQMFKPISFMLACARSHRNNIQIYHIVLTRRALHHRGGDDACNIFIINLRQIQYIEFSSHIKSLKTIRRVICKCTIRQAHDQSNTHFLQLSWGIILTKYFSSGKLTFCNLLYMFW